MRCTRLAFLFAMLCVWPAAAVARDAASSNGVYLINIRIVGDGVEISGTWRRPRETMEARSLQFLLSPLVTQPEIIVRCGRRDVALTALDHVEDGGDLRWTAEFDRPCPAGRQISVQFSYDIAHAAAPQLRTGARQGFAGGLGEVWYPQINYAWRETGRVAIETPAELAAIATGAPRRTRRIGEFMRSEFIVTTPAKFAFAYGRYRVLDVDGVVPVRVMSLSEAVDAEAIRQHVAQVIEPLTDAFGSPPFGALAVVEVDFRSMVLGTSEAGMLFVDSSEMAAEQADVTYWAHELAHQWWGVSLRAAPRSPGATLLSEGLAQYAALMALETAMGEEAAAAYRRANARHSIASYIAATAQTPDTLSLATALPANQDETIQLHRLATSKGAMALDYFARIVGRERFHRILRSFFRAHQGGTVAWRDLEHEIEPAFGGDTRTFFEQWLHRPGLPHLDVAWVPTSNGVHLHIHQISQTYTIELPVLVQTQAGVVLHRLNLRDSDENFELDTGGARVMGVVIDPAASIPMLPPVVHAPERNP